MKPAEKAIILFDSAREYAHANVFSFREESFRHSCRGIANLIVDEIIRENRTSYSLDWWFSVKEEINKL